METYTIELTRWGIVQGLPSKPYVNANYLTADANITGINNALQYAYDNGYGEVVLPRGEYAICYPNPILTKPNMVINFNASTLKVIYDSVSRSPLDTRTADTKVYDFEGTSIICNTPNTHIRNLKLIGDRIERSWVDVVGGISEEQRREGSNGVFFQTGSNNSSISHCDISFYMGDAISTGFNGYKNIKSITQVEFGDINASGIPIVSTDAKRIRSSAFMNIPVGVKIVSVLGIAYAPATSIPSGRYDAVFYNNTDTFVFKTNNIRTRDPVVVPKGATKIKLTWVGDGTLDQGLLPNNPAYYALLVEDSISDGVVIEHNTIYGCHRGGIFLGSNNATIRKNYLHDTGSPLNKDVYGLPTFTDFTRYSITSEDNYGHNCKILDNVFENTRMAIAMRGEFNDISGNEFKNCTYSLIMYNQEYVFFQNNTLYNAELHSYPYTGKDRGWIISDNIIDGTNVTFTGTGTISTFSNNILKDNSTITSDAEILNFTNNTFIASSALTLGGTLIDNCKFISGSKIIDSTNSNVYDKIIRCHFIDSVININKSNIEIIVSDSVLRNSYYQLQASGSKYVLKNCKVDNATFSVVDHPTYAGLGRTKDNLDIKDSEIKLGHLSLIRANEFFSVVIKNSKITYTPTSNLTTGLVPVNSVYGLIEIVNSEIKSSNAFTVSQDISTLIDLMIKDSTFTNFSLNNAPVQTQSNLMTSEPTNGSYKLANTVQNKTPISGGSIGWVCTTEGIANNSAWISLKDYRIWNKINQNGFVYKTDITTSYTAARSCKTIPTFPTTVGQTVQDIGGATTWITSKAYVVGDAVLPTVSNGYWYECTTAGTSSTTEPTWGTSGTKVDGTVTWTTRKIVTWTNIGVKAIFKTYGTIS